MAIDFKKFFTRPIAWIVALFQKRPTPPPP
jgi:hypothetical protein